MSKPEKTPKDASKPELEAILPDVFSDLDNYQKKIENDWETTKNAYKTKINEILDDFVAQSPSKSAASVPVADPVSNVEDRMERLLSRVEHTLRSGERRSRPSIISIPWQPVQERLQQWRRLAVVLVVGALVVGGAYVQWGRIPTLTPLPYIHPSTLAFVGDKIYIVEWFRKALYQHAFRKNLPIQQVENIPNNFLSGVAFSDKYLWTLDAFGHQILQHSLTGDHRVLKSFPTPGEKPAGLFWDGVDIWSADLNEKKVYRHYGTDPETVKASYGFGNFNVSSLYYKENRLWVLDGKSRMVYLCRLEDPLRIVASYDLDPLLKGASPNDFTLRGKTLWMLTENPPQLVRLSGHALKKLKLQ